MINIKNLQQIDFPINVHNKIMRKIYFLKFLIPLLFIIVLTTINLINSAWHFLIKAAEMQTWSVIATMFDHFELSLDYLKSLAITTLENTPVNLMPALIINLILICYMIYIFKYFKRSNYNLNLGKINF
jgi:hypothetical protein